MVWIILFGAVAYGFLILSLRFIGLYSAKIAKAMIDRLVEDANVILKTGRAPYRWIKKRATRYRPERPAREAQTALKSIDKIVRFYEKTSLVEDETTRTQILECLGSTRARWQQKGWEAIRPVISSSDDVLDE